jgi:hypothetical protein
MKIVEWIARILLGVIFVFFGSNLLFHFLPNPPLPPGPAKDFTTVLFVTHYIEVVGFFQALGGLLLFVNRFVPLALAILAPVIVNILATHLLVIHSGVFPLPTLVVLLWLFLFWRNRAAFSGVFGISAAA